MQLLEINCGTGADAFWMANQGHSVIATDGSQHGYDNEVFDSTFSFFDKQPAKLLEQRPQVVVIYTNVMTKLNVLRIINYIKSRDELQHTKIVLGGPEVRNHAIKDICGWRKGGRRWLVKKLTS